MAKRLCSTAVLDSANNNPTTSPELHDVWVDLIGPHLNATDIVVLSTVNRWGRHTAHLITHHQGSMKVNCLTAQHVNELSMCWPYLSLELELTRWDQDKDVIDPKLLHRVVSWGLWWCNISNFEIINTQKLEEFFVQGPFPNTAVPNSLGRILSLCTSLVSLELSLCVDKSDVQWLATALQMIPQLVSLNLCRNELGSQAIAMIIPALSRMPHIQSLNLGFNDLRRDGLRHVSGALICMTHITCLKLHYNQIRWNDIDLLNAVLPLIPRLRELDIEGNAVSEMQFRIKNPPVIIGV
eukprot:c21990_g1_i1.p1 GENE.c21990_g1_i1~~c21990_g1_i1.p1  ORF type:complete len:296 (-),score=61.09 c21990_g1_i1:35-922(-)